MKNTNNDKRIVIAYVIDFLVSQEGLTGGTERQLIEMLSHIDQSRFRPILFCLQQFVETPYWDAIKCEKHILHVYSLASLKGLKAFFSFISFLRHHSVDIVQTFFHDSTIFGVLAAKLAGVTKTISCRRDMGFWYAKNLLKNLRFVNIFTDRILVNCFAVKDAVVYHEHVKPEKVDVVYNGIDLQVFDMHTPINLYDEYNDIEKGNMVIGIVANFNREVKRLDLFIMAAAEVVKQYDNVRFLVIGDGRLESILKDLINNLGLNGKIIMGGKKDTATPYIKSFDIGVLSSDSEGFSNVLLEYMAAGIPVIATDVGGNREILKDNTLGLLVRKGDHIELASTICNLLADQKRCIEIGMKARLHISDYYSWDIKVKEIEQYYEQLIISK